MIFHLLTLCIPLSSPMSGTTWALVSSTLRAALALSTAASTEERTGWCCECERGWCHGTCGGGPRVVRDPAAVHVQEDLTLALGAVPPHVPPTLALAHRALAQCLLISRHLAWCRHLRGQVRVADHVDVRLQARVDGGAGLEWVEVLRPGPHAHQGRVLVTSPVPGSHIMQCLMYCVELQDTSSWSPRCTRTCPTRSGS